jgi:double zinc ribbon protein
VAAGGVVALTPFLFPLGVIAYRVVRPPETVTERAARDLESYVLAASVDHTRCRTCSRTVDETWMRCPACGADLAVACPACGGRVGFDWSVCAWCAHDLEPLGDAATMPAHVVPIDVPAAMADLGGGPLATTEALDRLPAEEPASTEPRTGAIPGWDPTVVLPAVPESSPDAPPPGDGAPDDTAVGIPVFDPLAPGAASPARTTTWAATDDERTSASSWSSRGSRAERRTERVTVPPELERRR